MKKIVLGLIIVGIVVAVSAGVFFGMAFLVVFLLSDDIPSQNDERPDRPFFVSGDAFKEITTIKSEECLDLVEEINRMNPGNHRVELYQLWLEDCIQSDPAIPSLP